MTKIEEDKDSGKRTHVLISDSRITAQNKLYKQAKKNKDDKACREIIEIGKRILFEIKFELEEGVAKELEPEPLAEYNKQILRDFIRKKVEIKTKLKVGSKRSEIGYLTKAVSLMGLHSLKTCEVEVIQNILDACTTKGENRHLIMRYRKLLRFIGRHNEAEQLSANSKLKEPEPAYLTIEQVRKLAKNVPAKTLENYPLLPEMIRIIFNLGLRMSEFIALDKPTKERKTLSKSPGGNLVVHIDKQYVRKNNCLPDESDRLRETKNKTKRTIIPINAEELLRDLNTWWKAYPKMEDRDPYRDAIDNYLRVYCKKLFNAEDELEDEEGEISLENLSGTEENRKYKSAHMLRAGHAVHMMGITNDNAVFVAKQLGDTEEVVRRNYAGKVNKALSQDEVAKLINKKAKKIA